jgi:hypothetical protein
VPVYAGIVATRGKWPAVFDREIRKHEFAFLGFVELLLRVESHLLWIILLDSQRFLLATMPHSPSLLHRRFIRYVNLLNLDLNG